MATRTRAPPPTTHTAFSVYGLGVGRGVGTYRGRCCLVEEEDRPVLVAVVRPVRQHQLGEHTAQCTGAGARVRRSACVCTSDPAL